MAAIQISTPTLLNTINSEAERNQLIDADQAASVADIIQSGIDQAAQFTGTVDGVGGELVLDLDRIHIDKPLIARTGLKLIGASHGSRRTEIRPVVGLQDQPFAYADEFGNGMRLITNTDAEMKRGGKNFITLENLEVNGMHVEGLTLADFRFAPNLTCNNVRFSNIGAQSTGFVCNGLLYPKFTDCDFAGKGRAVDMTSAIKAYAHHGGALGAYYAANKCRFIDCTFNNSGGSVFGGAVTLDHCHFEHAWDPYSAPLMANGQVPKAIVETRDFVKLNSNATIGHLFTMEHCYFEVVVPEMVSYHQQHPYEWDPTKAPLVAVYARGGVVSIQHNEFHGQTPYTLPNGDKYFQPGSIAVDASGSAGVIDRNDFNRWEHGYDIESPNYKDGGWHVGIGNRFQAVGKKVRMGGGFFPGMHGKSSNCLTNPKTIFSAGHGYMHSRHAVRTCDYEITNGVIHLGAANAFRVNCSELTSSTGREYEGAPKLYKWIGGDYVLRFDVECTVAPEVFGWDSARTFQAGEVVALRLFADGEMSIVSQVAQAA